MKLSDAGFRPLPTPIPTEELEEGEKETVASEYVTTLQIRKDSLPFDSKFRYFVDGVLRSAVIGFCDLGIKIPVIAANIAVGAGEIRNAMVTPFHNFITYATILLLPETAISNRIPNFRLSLGSNARLDHGGDFINKVQLGVPSDSLGTFLLCDTTFDFQHNQKVDDHNLAAPGYVYNRAMSALSVILRALEVGLVGKIRAQLRDEFIVFDGPLVRDMFLMYGKLADKNLSGIVNLSDPSKTFNFLQKVVGIVKRVVVIPEDAHFQDVFKNNDYFYIPVYHKLVVDEKIGGEPHILSCFVYLRPEIALVIPSHSYEGLIRIDIPLPAILDKYEPDWHTKSSLTLSSQEINRLEDIVKNLLSLRKPLPHTGERHKIFSELYPINRIEAYLKSRLVPYPELKVKVLQRLRNLGLL
jgi:hypothetical protein